MKKLSPPLSRSGEFARWKRTKGMCCQCGGPVEKERFGTSYCLGCLQRARLRRRAIVGVKWRKGKPGRPPVDKVSKNDKLRGYQ